jgi:3-oxoacyl-[acyl-carrier protein] reductase
VALKILNCSQVKDLSSRLLQLAQSLCDDYSNVDHESASGRTIPKQNFNKNKAGGIMSQIMNGKTALVTGGSRGIGRAIAERLGAQGVAVAVNYARNEQLAQEVVKGIIAKGGKAVAVQADVAKPSEVRRLFQEAERALGGLDIVVANAGVHIAKPLIESTEAEYDYIFDTNTRGVFFTLQGAGRRVRDGGRIVVVSTGGTRMHFADMSLYLGSKGAIEQFARSLSVELGPRNVTVNVLSPGFTDTDMLPGEYREYGASLSPFKRVGSAEDVADVAVFLAGDGARWVTGQNLQAGGGVA